MIKIIQIIIILFALFAWSRVIIRYKKKEVEVGGLIFWSTIWIAMILVALYYIEFNSISIYLGTDNIFNFAVYVSVLLLLYLVYRLYVMVGTQQKEITKLVREVAINNSKKKK